MRLLCDENECEVSTYDVQTHDGAKKNPPLLPRSDPDMCVGFTSEDVLVRQLNVLTVIVTRTPTVGFASTMLIARTSETSDNWTDRHRHTIL